MIATPAKTKPVDRGEGGFTSPCAYYS
jgi:hypothetical protein